MKKNKQFYVLPFKKKIKLLKKECLVTLGVEVLRI